MAQAPHPIPCRTCRTGAKLEALTTELVRLRAEAAGHAAAKSKLQRAADECVPRPHALTAHAVHLASVRTADFCGLLSVCTVCGCRCVERLLQLAAALDATDAEHNDDSLLQFMLFSSA